MEKNLELYELPVDELLTEIARRITGCEDAKHTWWEIKTEQDEKENYLVGKAKLTIDVEY